jgi:ABC-type amino acid transport substrate-binding protein
VVRHFKDLIMSGVFVTKINDGDSYKWLRKILKHFQFVNYYPEWQGFGFRKTKPKEGLYLIFEWFVFLGYWNIRRWRKNPEKALEDYNGEASPTAK